MWLLTRFSCKTVLLWSHIKFLAPTRCSVSHHNAFLKRNYLFVILLGLSRTRWRHMVQSRYLSRMWKMNCLIWWDQNILKNNIVRSSSQWARWHICQYSNWIPCFLGIWESRSSFAESSQDWLNVSSYFSFISTMCISLCSTVYFIFLKTLKYMYFFK